MPDESGIDVKVNGESMRLPAGSTVADLLKALAVPATHVAVEHNLRVVPRAEHAAVRLNHGDSVEVVTFVGGG